MRMSGGRRTDTASQTGTVWRVPGNPYERRCLPGVFKPRLHLCSVTQLVGILESVSRYHNFRFTLPYEVYRARF
jgi:hypothetical protein